MFLRVVSEVQFNLFEFTGRSRFTENRERSTSTISVMYSGQVIKEHAKRVKRRDIGHCIIVAWFHKVLSVRTIDRSLGRPLRERLRSRHQKQKAKADIATFLHR